MSDQPPKDQTSRDRERDRDRDQPPNSPRPARWSALLDKRAPSPAPSIGSNTAPSPSLKSPRVVLGICAMDVKARSKAMREIITRLVDIEKGGVDVKIFGDVVILEEGGSCLFTRCSVECVV